MDNSESTAWVFDSLVGFLHGPVWNAPLQTFIEEKSLIFEPTESGEVLDNPEYKKIHEQYRDLVDVMLGSFMDDIGISTDQFEEACRMSAADLSGLPAYFHRRLFELIWAANDYNMFVKMMAHKNVELQLQALEMIGRRFGGMPGLFSNGEDLDSTRSDESDDWPDADDVMTEIKNLHITEIESNEEVKVPPEEVVAEKKTLLSKLQSFEKRDEVEKARPVSPVETKPKVVEPPKKVEVSEEDMLARQEYLKQQRDKLLALKKQVREKRLDAADTAEEAGGGEGSRSVPVRASRPRSAKVAHAALHGAAPSPAPDAMQLRRALANKLKTEVVDSQH